MNTFLKSAFAAIVLMSAGAASADDSLLRRVDEIRAPGSDFAFTVDLSAGGSSQTLSVSVKDKTKSLVRYVAPAKVEGRSILFLGPNMWIYVPGTRRALRISPRQRVLGGVSSADVARTVYSEDYRVAGSEPSGDGHALRLEPRVKGAAYARIDLTIDERGAPLKAEYFTRGDRKIKTMSFGGYEPVLGETRPTRFVVTDHVEGGETTMIYSEFREIETPEAWYQPGNLGRF